MADVRTGPISIRSFESIETGSFDGPALEEVRGTVGMAVAYKGDAFRFEARITNFTIAPEVFLVAAEVTSLDGRHFRDLTFETDPQTGLAIPRSLQVKPLSDVGSSKPQQACFYDPDLPAANRREKLTSPDRRRFHQLGQSRHSSISVPAVMGSLSIGRGSVESAEPEPSASSRRRGRWTLFANVLPVRLPNSRIRVNPGETKSP